MSKYPLGWVLESDWNIIITWQLSTEVSPKKSLHEEMNYSPNLENRHQYCIFIFIGMDYDVLLNVA